MKSSVKFTPIKATPHERKFTSFKGGVVQLLNFIKAPQERANISSQSRKTPKLTTV